MTEIRIGQLLSLIHTAWQRLRTTFELAFAYPFFLDEFRLHSNDISKMKHDKCNEIPNLYFACDGPFGQRLSGIMLVGLRAQKNSSGFSLFYRCCHFQASIGHADPVQLACKDRQAQVRVALQGLQFGMARD